ncbi:MAG: BREX-1 system adenine-specific DNA-methyltransferase PglX, partial [Clostridiales bacterium]
YLSCGYTKEDAVSSILQHNLYGIDIDKRAFQLTYFALNMKARSYDRGFFTRGISSQVYCPKGYTQGEEYGSLLNVDELEAKPQEPTDLTLFNMDWEKDVNTWNFRRLLNQKYDVVVTNPPYMGNSGMGGKLADFVKKNYPDSKSDLFACFMEQGNQMTKPNGYNCMVTMQSWMFLSSFEKMRKKMLNQTTITNLMHMENMVMGIAFGTAVTVFRNSKQKKYKGIYNQIKMCDIESSTNLPKEFPVQGNRFAQVSTENFKKIPGAPIAYWVSENMLGAFEKGVVLGDIAFPKTGMTTGDNNRFLRFWYEINFCKAMVNAKTSSEAQESGMKWFPYCKGGGYMRWYGYNEYLINWENNGFEIKNNIKDNGNKTASVRSEQLYFQKLITWSAVTSGKFSCRNVNGGALFDSGGSSISINSDSDYILALLNGKIGQYYLDVSNATINYQPGDIASIPVIISNKEEISSFSEQNISLSKTDWDSFETSWDFEQHPLIRESTVQMAFAAWEQECNHRFNTLKSNEEELNRIFIEIYGLQDELTPEVADKDVTVRKADLTRDIKSLISYAVGCMFGRYSLDVEGIAFAGGEFDSSKYSTFIPDCDNILPITDEEYFEDDIVSGFVEFVRLVYGDDTVEENLDFIAEALGNKGGSPRQVIRNYFRKDFYKDHCKIYQKRPIYWLFDSGKADSFKALIYLHRYDCDTVGRVRTDYLHKQQGFLENAIEYCDYILNSSQNPRDKADATKRKNKLVKQLAETKLYDQAMGHIALQRIDLDLDDGVKVNYQKFQGVEVAREGQKTLSIDLLGKI